MNSPGTRDPKMEDLALLLVNNDIAAHLPHHEGKQIKTDASLSAPGRQIP